MASSERTPLLWDFDHQSMRRVEHRELARAQDRDLGEDVHAQFCALVGCPPSNAPEGYKFRVNDKSLYGRSTRLLRSQNRTYMWSAGISNTLLLVQVVLGAALTGLGASNSPGWVITLFGATNTVIAGVVAYLKSRGQPMRARVYRDDVERVVNEIENSEIMWLGISQSVHGYDDIDTDGEVTVRSEVARLTRLYDRAVRNNTMNNPDMYMAGGNDSGARSGLRSGYAPQMTNVAMPGVMPNAAGDNAPAAPVPAPIAVEPVATDEDQSPASARPKPKDDKKQEEIEEDGKISVPESSKKNEEGSGKAAVTGESSGSSAPVTAATAAPKAAAVPDDPDASPATKPKFTKKKSESEETPKKVSGDAD